MKKEHMLAEDLAEVRLVTFVIISAAKYCLTHRVVYPLVTTQVHYKCC